MIGVSNARDITEARAAQELLQHQAGHDALTGLAARLGGDEFAVLLPGADLATAERVAARFRAALAAPVPVAGRLIEIGAGVGCAAGPAGEPEGLLNRADQRVYERKRLLATRRAG